MSIKVTVSGDMRAITKHMSDTQKKVIPRAQVMALNKVAPKVRTQTVRAVAADMAIPARVVRKRLNFKGRLKANRRTMEAVIAVSGTPIPIHEIGRPRVMRGGVRVGKGVYPGAFLPWSDGRQRHSKAVPRNNVDVAVFSRVGRRRLPVSRVMVRDLVVAARRHESRAVFATAAREYPIEMERALMEQLRRLG